MRFAESKATQGTANVETVRKPFGTLLMSWERDRHFISIVSPNELPALSLAIFIMLFVLELGMEFSHVRKKCTFNYIPN